MEARQFLTPSLVVDGSQLAFVGPIEPGREAETFATLLTFTTFAEKSDSVIDRAFPLEKAAEAHRRMESSEHVGKILLAVKPGIE